MPLLRRKTKRGDYRDEAVRRDALGIFWQDEPPAARVKKEAVKRTPPEPTWLRPDYLPGLKEAQEFNVSILTPLELNEAVSNREEFIYDVESYSNYFLVAFTSLRTGKVIYFEAIGEDTTLTPNQITALSWVMHNLTLVGFNSRSYDNTILAMATAGCKCREMKDASTLLIRDEVRPYEVLKKYGVKALKGVDHIDLIEVAPLRASLKIYGGRLHTKQMQDLPFHPSTVLSDDQITITRWYCVNDLTQTAHLRMALDEQLKLRLSLSNEYGIDLRSKSDAQIAEAVIADELTKLNGHRPRKPFIEPGTRYRYRVPDFINFLTPRMNWVLDIIRKTDFIVSPGGNVGMPPELQEMKIQLADGIYRMGIGGLHSSEKKTAHYEDEHYILVDRDVTSYYPWIILLLGLFPEHLGVNFLRVYHRIVTRRLDAKKRGDKVIADSLKITINGSFGKLGSPFSMLYAPDLLIQTTVTGQLALLMLIEALELNDITVVSANTDGIVIKCRRNMQDRMDEIFKWWEGVTGFGTEETPYRAVYSRDVNNYLAIKPNGEIKSKGAFSRPGLQKNPVNEICIEAVEKKLTTGASLSGTIRGCNDIRMFVTVRTVKGGAVKVRTNGDGTDSTEYLGKAIRWYYAQGEEGEIVYAKSGNKVPRSDGAKPLMKLPDHLPSDINYEWYIEEAEKMLGQLGYYSNES